jgi:type IV secretory pathway TraG/TraD family ATPase VirD4
MDKELLLVMLRKACSSGKAHFVVREFYNWLDDIVRTRNRGINDVYQFTQNATSFLMSSQVRDSLKTSNIDILSMKSNPMSLYLILDMNKLTQNGNYYRPLIRLFVTICIMGVSTNEQPKDKILFMLDEIAQLGKLQYLTNLLTIYRSQGLVVWTIWQNLSQIKEHYEKSWQTIMGNCDVQQFFGVNDEETAEYVSKLAGTTTIYEESTNTDQTISTGQTETEARGEQYSRGTSHTEGDTTGYSYQGFNCTRSGSHSSSDTTSNNYTDSYTFSRAIQRGFSETRGKHLAKKTAPLITPYDVRAGKAYGVQFVFYEHKCPYPILSGKIKYYEDKEFYGEYGENLTRI